MVKVAGMWEQGWNTPFLEHDLWEYPLRDFGVGEHYMIPVTGILKPVTEKHSIEEILEENKELTVVWVDEFGETSLKDFIHPENVLYFVGKTTSRPMVQHRKPDDLSVRIETKPDGSNQGMLWGHQAISIVLYDRLRKQKWL
jgi:tRNA(Leu) C34 or U34 (ribose-2'-O)-methylase TrmL